MYPGRLTRLQSSKATSQRSLPTAIWSPLRCALDERLVERGGVLNFAQTPFGIAVRKAFLPDAETETSCRKRLADFFEREPLSERACDELPWLLQKTGQSARLRSWLLNIDNVVALNDWGELRRYWVDLGEVPLLGELYVEAFEGWKPDHAEDLERVALAATRLADVSLGFGHARHAEILTRAALEIEERRLGSADPRVAEVLCFLAGALAGQNRLAEARESILRALEIDSAAFGPSPPGDRARFRPSSQQFSG